MVLTGSQNQERWGGHGDLVGCEKLTETSFVSSCCELIPNALCYQNVIQTTNLMPCHQLQPWVLDALDG